MDIFAARFTTTIDPRFVPVIRGTLLNASRKPVRRLVTSVFIVGSVAYALRLLFPGISWPASLLTGIAAMIVGHALLIVPVFLTVRRQARARYGALPALVRVRFIQDGLAIDYPRQETRRVSFSFVNNWWLERERIIVILGARMVERCAIMVDAAVLEARSREWLLTRLGAAREVGLRARAPRS